MKLFVIGVFCVLFAVPLASAYNILVLLPFPGTSQWLFLKTYIETLVSRGHAVTAITNFKYGKPLDNYTEIVIDPIFDFSEFQLEIFKIDSFKANALQLLEEYGMGVATSQHAYADPKIQEFIKREDLRFDLVIAELFVYESWLMLAHKYKAPIVGINTFGCTNFYDSAMGMVTPWSIVPHDRLPYTSMTLLQRFHSVGLYLFDVIVRSWYFMPQQNELAKENFKHLEKHGPLPSIEDLEKSIAVILVNDHVSFTSPRPAMPGIVRIAGAHIKTPKKLPSDIQKYLDDATEGVIYFSLGSNVRSSDMPAKRLNIFFDSFKQLKQRVLWKFEDENKIQNLPPNVMVKKWLPQSDILAHKNVVLFISHGGLFSTIESMERGVPTLLIPLFGDQYRNAMKSVNFGRSLMIQLGELSTDALLSKLKELLENPKYRATSKKMSALLKDNPVHPMDESMFWIEYVIRNRGAGHLKSHSVNLPIWSYLLLDVIGISLLVVLGVVMVFYKLLKKIRKLLGRNTVQVKNVSGKQKSKTKTKIN